MRSSLAASTLNLERETAGSITNPGIAMTNVGQRTMVHAINLYKLNTFYFK